MSLTKMGGQVALTVTPEDLHHFANALLAQSRKEWEEQAASVRKEESEETFLTTEDVCKIFNVCPATLWYPASAVKAITHARSMNETVVGYCKRKSKVDKNLPNAYDNDSKESV